MKSLSKNKPSIVDYSKPVEPIIAGDNVIVGYKNIKPSIDVGGDWEKEFDKLFVKGHPPISNGSNDVQEADSWVEANPEDLKNWIRQLVIKTPTTVKKQKDTDWENNIEMANKIADILNVSKSDRKCNGEHPSGGCIWEKCFDIWYLFQSEKQKSLQEGVDKTVEVINKRLDDLGDLCDHIPVWKSAIKDVVNSEGTLKKLQMLKKK